MVFIQKERNCRLTWLAVSWRLGPAHIRVSIRAAIVVSSRYHLQYYEASNLHTHLCHVIPSRCQLIGCTYCLRLVSRSDWLQAPKSQAYDTTSCFTFNSKGWKIMEGIRAPEKKLFVKRKLKQRESFMCVLALRCLH